MGESFWQKDSLVTHILPELWLITHTILSTTKFADSHVRRPTFINEMTTLIFEVLHFLKMCPIFVCSVHNFGKSEGTII